MTQNPFQKAARAALSGKRLPGEDPDLDHVVAELSGVGSLSESISRVDKLYIKVGLIRSALIYEQGKRQIAQGTPAQAALWFLENVPDDDPNRSDLFFLVKARLTR